MQPFTKVVRPGTGPDGSVFCEIEFGNKGRLSISGVVGPKRNGDCRGGCGQIVDHLAEDVSAFAPGWDIELLQRFADTWKRWHLNDMRAGCEHQRAEGWDKRPIDPNKPTNTYGKHFEGQKQDSWNLLGWITESEHPDGLMCRACPVCGYKYGTAWLKEEVPSDVIVFLQRLPDTDRQPAWV